ncbi:hypothetical protein [Sessilibacter sp. MAH4]
MKNLKLSSYSILFAAAMLTACGGSNSSSERAVVGVETENLTILGSTTGGLLPGSQVTLTFTAPDLSETSSSNKLQRKLGFTKANQLTTLSANSEKIDGEMLTAIVDEDGNFEINAQFIAGDFSGDELVTVSIRGVGEQSQIELISQVGDIDFLLASSGGGEIVTTEELSRLNVSPLSTALAIAARDVNNNVISNNWDEIQALEIEAGTFSTIRLLTAIRFIIESDLTLEGDLTLVESYFSNANSSEEISRRIFDFNGLLNAQGSFSEELQNQLNTILGSVLFSGSFTLPTITGLTNQPLILSRPFVRGTHPDMSTNILELNDNGTANFFERNLAQFESTRLTWQQTEAGVISTSVTAGDSMESFVFVQTEQLELFGVPGDIANFIRENTGGGFVEILMITEEINLIPISVNEISTNLFLDHSVRINLDNVLEGLNFEGEVPEIFGNGFLNGEFVTVNNPQVVFNRADFVSEQWALTAEFDVRGVFDSPTSDRPSQELLSFNDDGTTGLGLINSRSGNWNVADGVLNLEIGDNNLRYYPLLETQDDVFAILERIDPQGDRTVIATNMAKLISEQTSSFATEFIRAEPTVESAEVWLSDAHLFFETRDYDENGNVDFGLVTGFSFSQSVGSLDVINEIEANQIGAFGSNCIESSTIECFQVRDTLVVGLEGERITLSDLPILNNPTLANRTRELQVLSYDEDRQRAVVLDHSFTQTNSAELIIEELPRINVLQLINLARDYPQEYLAEPTLFNQ